MAHIRRLENLNFRSNQLLDWTPFGGLKCLIGPVDNGKSSILDSIEGAET